MGGNAKLRWHIASLDKAAPERRALTLCQELQTLLSDVAEFVVDQGKIQRYGREGWQKNPPRTVRGGWFLANFADRYLSSLAELKPLHRSYELMGPL